MSKAIEMSIPLELTAAQIIRAKTGFSEIEALEYAEQLHDIIEEIRAGYAKLPSATLDDAKPLEIADLIDATRRQALSLSPIDHEARLQESDWLFEWIERCVGDDIHRAYLRLCDRLAPKMERA